MGFTPYWDYKPTNEFLADSLSVYTSDKTLNLYTMAKIHLKCDVIDGSILDGLRQCIPSVSFRINRVVIYYFAHLKVFFIKNKQV